MLEENLHPFLAIEGICHTDDQFGLYAAKGSRMPTHVRTGAATHYFTTILGNSYRAFQPKILKYFQNWINYTWQLVK